MDAQRVTSSGAAIRQWGTSLHLAQSGSGAADFRPGVEGFLAKEYTEFLSYRRQCHAALSRSTRLSRRKTHPCARGLLFADWFQRSVARSLSSFFSLWPRVLELVRRGSPPG